MQEADRRVRRAGRWPCTQERGRAAKFVTWLAIVVGFGAAAPAAVSQDQMRLTFYDDGLACPNDCDAHVVFAPRHNGTRNAFAPPMSNRTRAAANKCVNGQPCIICFDQSDSSCLETIYRGNGPPAGKFDVTPAFLEERCAVSTVPAPVRDLCRSLDRGARPYATKINCIRNPATPVCADQMRAVEQSAAADRREHQQCLKLGVRRYNNGQADRMKHRSLNAGCGYAENQRERNSRGIIWQRLMPGACRPGTYVGRWGTDCCTGVVLTDASYGGAECAAYYR